MVIIFLVCFHDIVMIFFFQIYVGKVSHRWMDAYEFSFDNF